MTLFDYAKKYNYTFTLKKFNEVDNLILATLIYLDFSKNLGDDEKITLGELADRYIKAYKKDKEITAVRVANKLIRIVKDNPRFKDILVYNYVYKSDDYSQFSAITFEFGNTIYIAYEGTDELVSGWEEDFDMAHTFPVKAHKEAIKYLNPYTFTKKNIILGGHSKGGNLALVAGMLSNIILRSKIINIYSNDGQGLRKTELNSVKYKRIRRKFIHLIPQNSIIGLLFRHQDDIVIKANALTLFSHIPSTWKVVDDHFERTELVKSSLIFDKGLSMWLDKYNYTDRKKFIKEVFNVFRENGITSTVQLRNNFKDVVNIIRSSGKISDEVKDMFNELINIINIVRKENSK